MVAAPHLTGHEAQILNAIQWRFPLGPEPFDEMGSELGVSGAEVIRIIDHAKKAHVVRQLSAIFDTRCLGYSSSLVAAKVDPRHIDQAAATINEHPGVSHNYKRNHAYNLWYTVACPPDSSLTDHIDALHRASGALVTRYLPTLTLYKIGVKLDMTGTLAPDAKAEILPHERPPRSPDMPAPELGDLEIRAIRRLQEDLPLVPRPFKAEAADIGISEGELLRIMESLRQRKLMRRFAAVMNHRSAGFKANAMAVWAVPAQLCDELGPKMAGFASVSHCYRRPVYEDWPYSVFTMIHGRSARDCEVAVDAIRRETEIEEHCLLWSSKEYKKIRLKYFTREMAEWEMAHLAVSGG
jgi:siroheme decarboxylase